MKNLVFSGFKCFTLCTLLFG